MAVKKYFYKFVWDLLAAMSQQLKAIKKRVGRLTRITWFLRVGATGF
tara:strand:- start:839 stop:979 length:141 start_codon:yes stop_codon:yes gene_type:complete